MRPLVSVIVPVYRVEPWLARCLDSLRSQSLADIEVIVIDDASPDRCGEICEAYAAEDARFRVFHNAANRGLSDVRNFGIKQASGEFLMFADSDDWVHRDFCKDAWECAVKHQADLVISGWRRIKNPGDFEKPDPETGNPGRSGFLTQTESIDLLHRNAVWQAPWNKLYRKGLFDGISFPSGRLYEGTGTVYKTVLRASSIYFLDKALYYYRCRPDSITAAKTEKTVRDWIDMSVQQYDDLAAWGYPADKLAAFLKKRALRYCVLKKPDDSDSRYAFCEKILREGRSFPDGFSRKQKALLFLFKYCRPLFEWVCAASGKRVC